MRTYLLSSSLLSEVSAPSAQGVLTPAEGKRYTDRSAGTSKIRESEEREAVLLPLT